MCVSEELALHCIPYSEGMINYSRVPKNALELEGKYWVGTAPSNMYKSMNATTYGEHMVRRCKVTLA